MTSITRTEPRYGLMAIVLHWVLAVFILSVFAVGVYMADLRFPLPSSNWSTGTSGPG